MSFIENLELRGVDIADTQEWIDAQVPDDGISDAIVSKYNGNYVAVVIDPTHANTRIAELVKTAYAELATTDPILLFGAHIPDLECIRAIPVPEQYYIKLLKCIKTHIVTGSAWSWWMARIANPVKCAVPTRYPMGYHQFPMIDGAITIDYMWSYSRWFDNVYYINLERRADRRQHMEDQLRAHHLRATRVSALDGSKIKWSPAYGVHGTYWNTRSYAYCISYRAALLDARKYNRVLILDDDAVFTPDFECVLNSACKALPKDWHMLYFGANHQVIPTEKIGDDLLKLKSSFSSHAIIMNKVCYEGILQFLYEPYGPLDIYLSIYHQFFPCYITSKCIAYQAAGYSDILCKDVDYCDQYGIGK